jgi:predicted permease
VAHADDAGHLAGLAVSLSGIELWPPLLVAIRMLGDISIPLLLFTLGVRLAGCLASMPGANNRRWPGRGAARANRHADRLGRSAWALGLARLAAARSGDMLLVFGALPPAVLNYVFAERYRRSRTRWPRSSWSATSPRCCSFVAVARGH